MKIFAFNLKKKGFYLNSALNKFTGLNNIQIKTFARNFKVPSM